MNIRRAYYKWKNLVIHPWEEILHEFAIQPVQQVDLTKGKNAADIALGIDVMDVLYTRNVDVVCLVSSDCDFTPLVTRTFSDGKVVLGFGERKAPKSFVNACSKFLYLDEPESKVPKKSEVKKSIKSDTRLIKPLHC